MSQITKNYVDVIILSFMVLLAALFIGEQVQTRKANMFLNNCVQQIEASNMSNAVINECVSKANEEYGSNSLSCTSYGSVNHKYGQLTLKYEYEIPILKYKKEKILQADIN